jgi:putative ABC transport system substrate-binding protein
MVSTRRRLVLALAAAGLVAPLSALAQAKKVWRIGFLGVETAAGYAKQIDAMRSGLRDYGFIEGNNLLFEYRWAEGKYEALPKLAADLVRGKADILVTHGVPATRAAKAATTQIPIVIASLGVDPIELGLVTSLARPGGNITGRLSLSIMLHAKQLELVHEIVPKARRIVFLYSSRGEPGTTNSSMQEAARKLRLDIQLVGANDAPGVESALSAVAQSRADALVVQNNSLFITQAARLADWAIKHRVPMIGNQEYAEAGALLGYGASILDNYRRVGYFVDRIAKGANPATMPIEQPSTFELVINKKTAKALGIGFPPAVLIRADRVIE